MIISDGKRVTPKQYAAIVWDSHLGGTCAWEEWFSENDSMTKREREEVLKQMDNLCGRMMKLLAKARGGS